MSDGQGQGMRLAGAVTQGSGVVNEDGMGHIAGPEGLVAAWVLDGVTGINDRPAIAAGSEAAWLVARVHERLAALAAQDLDLAQILARLVDGLIADWTAATRDLDIPAGHDPPAACLLLAKRHADGWKVLRLGDSCLLVRQGTGDHLAMKASPNTAFDQWLTREATKRRAAGQHDVKTLLADFRPQIAAGRRKRNQPGGYSVVEADRAALRLAEVIDLGWPQAMLLCTDGFYRAVDHYGLYDDDDLVRACAEPDGVDKVLAQLRAAEAADPHCLAHPRFKPADDATAVMLVSA
ncbi:MAG: protein phosphatase 2C domain-containing protein [Alphaproteobacteria bacterium]|nr:protein phosphatase 2C domain-containing protein [Alphaproteobacteria bacterium]